MALRAGSAFHAARARQPAWPSAQLSLNFGWDGWLLGWRVAWLFAEMPLLLCVPPGQTNSMCFTMKTSCVRRRYREFVWLRQRLQSNALLV